MKRKWAIRLTLILLLLLTGGTIVNITVAWTLMFRTSYDAFETEYRFSHDNLVEWPLGTPTEWPKPAMSEVGVAGGFQYLEASQSREETSVDDYIVDDWFASRLEVGWPLLALASLTCRHEHYDSATESERASSKPASFCTFANDHPTVLPERSIPSIPLWPGFAINTIFYAAILWLLLFIPGKVRRAIRRRRGLCPACAYPVGASDLCTECGKPLPQMRK